MGEPTNLSWAHAVGATASLVLDTAKIDIDSILSHYGVRSEVREAVTAHIDLRITQVRKIYHMDSE